MEKSKKKILLYNAIQTAYASSDNSPSFSLMAISAYLKKRGYQVELLFNKYSDEELKNALNGCLAIGFSLYSGGTKDSFKIVDRIKNIAPEIPLVWGGYHPTLEAKQSLKNNHIKYIIRGQGEYIFEELLKHFENPKDNPIEKIKGLSYRVDNHRLCHNETRQASDINEFPRFDYSLYDHVYKNLPAISYISSRGCPFACKFCCSANFNRNHGMRFFELTLDRVFDDLEFLLAKYHPKEINFWDDNFFINPQRIKQFIEGYKKRNFNFRWTAFGRCQFFANIEEELVKDLSEIGLYRIYFGVESGSQRILDMANKVMKVDDVTKALEKIKRHDILGDFTFINGFPYEEKSDVMKSLDFRNKIKNISPRSSVRFFVFTPLPGTEMLEKAVELGYKKPEHVKDWETYEYHSFQAPWMSHRYQKFVNNISWAAMFNETDTSINTNFFSKIIFDFLAKDAEFRFKHKTFAFAPEFGIINSLYRKKLSAS